MITIPIRVCGDYWINPVEVRSQLDNIAGRASVILDLQLEGPGLGCLEVINVVNEYCSKYHVDPKTVLIDNWSNSIEAVPYTVVNLQIRSHFFLYSKKYWLNFIPESTHRNVFGYFIGRRSIPRAVIMYQLYHAYKSRMLFSCLQNKFDAPWRSCSNGIQLEQLDDWLPKDQHENFCAWWETNPIDSIDNHLFEDSYITTMNTNLDLLKFYKEFDIELVAESYTRGLSFFPTEKTVRPLMAAKPILVQGPVRYLENLRKLGFETYSKVWDESYDLVEGPARWQAMQELINKIMNMNTLEYKEMIEQATEIAIRNRNHLSDIINLK
jgi:hypothetical protein